ncbi:MULTISPECIES: hypothetical protein [unclassified Shinella]|uniref:hypothetical protein n=1 Tax=unclassified Shinella TaxID=2643062 RepID=UPI00234EC581|nr:MULTISPECIES: hypothetical protein [unclassified Shinella]MCO5153378.1 hypothetical protein [Shinella sp.]MDC7260557.1 hypothetical protein [Shinella sp. HY16]MDC7267452.1 hypothetical protein [Shinella sp. YZ44]
MSLVRIAGRIAAVYALRGKTLVEDNVLDSQIAALDVDADGQVMLGADNAVSKKFISVYSDVSEMGEQTRTGIRSLSDNGHTSFLFEAGVAAAFAVVDPETDEAVLFEGIPATDTAFEFYLDLVMRQILDALLDPSEGGWADIFRSLFLDFKSLGRIRASGDSKGARLAAHQLLVRGQMIAEPVRGAELKPEHALMRFFAKAETLADDAVAAQIALMRAQLSGDATDMEVALRRFGLTHAETDALHLSPMSGTAEDTSISGVAVGETSIATGQS